MSPKRLKYESFQGLGYTFFLVGIRSMVQDLGLSERDGRLESRID